MEEKSGGKDASAADDSSRDVKEAPLLISVAQLAARLGVSQRTAYRVARQEMVHVWVRGCLRVPLVADPAVGAALDEGERYFSTSNCEAAIACAGLAFKLADSKARSSWKRAFPSSVSRTRSLKMEDLSDVLTRIERLESMLAVIAFGYDLVELARFNELIDRRTATMNPALQINTITFRGDATEADTRFALDFASFHAARLERRSPRAATP